MDLRPRSHPSHCTVEPRVAECPDALTEKKSSSADEAQETLIDLMVAPIRHGL